MNNGFRNDARDGAGTVSQNGGGNPGTLHTQTAATPPRDKVEFIDPAKHRQEQIKKLEARLQRAIARDSAASRKERNGQLFVWGAMVESIYREGKAHDRDLLRQWANRKLTDKRHLKRAECGFARIENEEAESNEA